MNESIEGMGQIQAWPSTTDEWMAWARRNWYYIAGGVAAVVLLFVMMGKK